MENAKRSEGAQNPRLVSWLSTGRVVLKRTAGACKLHGAALPGGLAQWPLGQLKVTGRDVGERGAGIDLNMPRSIPEMEKCAANAG